MTIRRIKQLMMGFLGFFVVGTQGVFAQDLMEKAFLQARTLQYVSNLGNTKDAVGNQVFQGSTNISRTGASQQDSMLVRWTRLALRLMIAIAISMVIYNGIKLIQSSGDAKAMDSATGNLKNVIIGIVLALSSVSIIYLMESITKTTLAPQGQSTNFQDFISGN